MIFEIKRSNYFFFNLWQKPTSIWVSESEREKQKLIHFYLITSLCSWVRCGGKTCFAQWTHSSAHDLDCFKCAIQSYNNDMVLLKRNIHYCNKAMNFKNWQSWSVHQERPDSAWSKEFYPAQLYCRSSSRNPLPCLCFGLCWLSPLNCCLCSSPTIENKLCGLPQ